MPATKPAPVPMAAAGPRGGARSCRPHPIAAVVQLTHINSLLNCPPQGGLPRAAGGA